MASTIIGTPQNPWKKEATTANNSLSAPGAFANVAAPSTGSGKYVIAVAAGAEFNNASIIIYGTSAVPVRGRAWIMNNVYTTSLQSDVVGVYAGEFTGTLGTAQGGGSGFSFATTDKFVDHITIVDDASNSPPGMRVVGDVDNAVAMLHFDGVGGKYVLIQLEADGGNGSTDKFGVAWRVF